MKTVLEHDNQEVAEQYTCPVCGCPENNYLGILGHQHWVKCCDCGIDYHIKPIDLCKPLIYIDWDLSNGN